MAYATVMHVQALDTARPPFSVTTRPSIDQVVQLLNSGAAEIDAVLRKKGIALPINASASSTLQLLLHINAVRAVHLVESTAPTGHNRDVYNQMWETAKKMLDDLELDALLDDSESRPRSGFVPDCSGPMFSTDMIL